MSCHRRDIKSVFSAACWPSARPPCLLQVLSALLSCGWVESFFFCLSLLSLFVLFSPADCHCGYRCQRSYSTVGEGWSDQPPVPAFTMRINVHGETVEVLLVNDELLLPKVGNAKAPAAPNRPVCACLWFFSLCGWSITSCSISTTGSEQRNQIMSKWRKNREPILSNQDYTAPNMKWCHTIVDWDILRPNMNQDRLDMNDCERSPLASPLLKIIWLASLFLVFFSHRMRQIALSLSVCRWPKALSIWARHSASAASRGAQAAAYARTQAFDSQGWYGAEVCGVEIVAGAGFQATIAHHMAYQAAQKAIDEIGWNVSHGFHSHSDTCGD